MVLILLIAIIVVITTIIILDAVGEVMLPEKIVIIKKNLEKLAWVSSVIYPVIVIYATVKNLQGG